MIRNKLLILSTCLTIWSCNESSKNFRVDIDIPVSVQTLTLNSIQETFTATGTIISEYETTLLNETAGKYFLQINPRTGEKYKMGDKVLIGEVVIKIEDKEYENNTNIKGALLDLEISKMEHEKQVALYEKGGVTLREKVNGEKQWVTATKNYENAKIKLDKMKISSPFNGVITDLPFFSQGVEIKQGKEVLQLMSYKEMVMDIMLPESQINKISINQKAYITNYSLPEDTLSGYLKEISPAIDVESRTFKGRLYIDNKEGLLRPGMFVKSDILVSKKDSVIVIPKDVIVSRDNEKVVFIARKNTAIEKSIVLGMESEDEVEVVDGLQVEERLIIKGFETLKNKSKIKVLNQ